MTVQQRYPAEPVLDDPIQHLHPLVKIVATFSGPWFPFLMPLPNDFEDCAKAIRLIRPDVIQNVTLGIG